jgi:hypothetical protein
MGRQSAHAAPAGRPRVRESGWHGLQPPRAARRRPAFWTTDGDIASLAAFARGFLARHGRQASPLYLAGEDFGTGRVAGLAAYLAERNVPVRGVILLSMQPGADAVAGDWQHINLLPSLILTAWHHKKLAPELSSMSLEQIAGEARKFASRDDLRALQRRPDDRRRADEAIANVSRLTGLSKAFVTANDLRIAVDRFAAELRGRAEDARVLGQPRRGVRAADRGRWAGFHSAAASQFPPGPARSDFQTAYDGYLLGSRVRRQSGGRLLPHRRRRCRLHLHRQ